MTVLYYSPASSGLFSHKILNTISMHISIRSLYKLTAPIHSKSKLHIQARASSPNRGSTFSHLQQERGAFMQHQRNIKRLFKAVTQEISTQINAVFDGVFDGGDISPKIYTTHSTLQYAVTQTDLRHELNCRGSPFFTVTS